MHGGWHKSKDLIIPQGTVFEILPHDSLHNLTQSNAFGYI